MKKLNLTAIFCFVLVALLLVVSSFLIGVPKSEVPDVFVGVDVAHNDVEEIKELVDEIDS